MKTVIKLILTIFSLLYSQDATYILCEGNFQQNNGSIWEYISNDSDYIIFDTAIPVDGDLPQSLLVHDDKLYVVVNGGSEILIFNIDGGSLTYNNSISTNFSGPRDIVIVNDTAFITEWYTQSVAVLDLGSMTITSHIPVSGMPEDIIYDGANLWVSIIYDAYWGAAGMLHKINPETHEITDTYNTEFGPVEMVYQDGKIYLAHLYYDLNWVTYSGTSEFDIDSGSFNYSPYNSMDYTYLGNDIELINGDIYRTIHGMMDGNGIVKLDENLNAILESQIGNYTGIYSFGANDGKLYLGLTDFSAPDNVVVLDMEGNELDNYTVGGIPGDFAFYSSALEISEIGLPENYSVFNIYPNPFNPAANIAIFNVAPGYIELAVYDLKGGLVEVLTEGLHPGGKLHFSWNPGNSGLPSGIYFSRFNSESESISRMITYLK